MIVKSTKSYPLVRVLFFSWELFHEKTGVLPPYRWTDVAWEILFSVFWWMFVQFDEKNNFWQKSFHRDQLVFDGFAAY